MNPNVLREQTGEQEQTYCLTFHPVNRWNWVTSDWTSYGQCITRKDSYITQRLNERRSSDEDFLWVANWTDFIFHIAFIDTCVLLTDVANVHITYDITIHTVLGVQFHYCSRTATSSKDKRDPSVCQWSSRVDVQWPKWGRKRVKEWGEMEREREWGERRKERAKGHNKKSRMKKDVFCVCRSIWWSHPIASFIIHDLADHSFPS